MWKILFETEDIECGMDWYERFLIVWDVEKLHSILCRLNYYFYSPVISATRKYWHFLSVLLA